jgi:glutamyl-tRNA reductase
VSLTSRAQVGPSSETSVPPVASDSALTPAAALVLFGFEFSLDTASIDALEAVARSVTRTQVREWFSGLPGTDEVALLSTCHRVELVVLARFPEDRDRWQGLLPGAEESWKLREGREVVRHLFRVAAGRESLAVGEAEVRQQVRAAGSSVESRHPRPVLRELFRRAAEAAEEVGSSVVPARSIASVATSRMLDLIADPLPRVLVVGSGIVGRQVTECLASSARVTLVFHQNPPEEEFLRAQGARAVPFDRLWGELATSDAVITAAKLGNRGLKASDLPRDRPLVLLDLGMPRNIDPDVRTLSNVRLVDLEELHASPGSRSLDDAHDLRVEDLAARFCGRLDRLLLEPWVDAFRRAAEEVRRSELAQAGSFLGNLDSDQEAAVERLTQRLVNRLLAAPTEWIRSLPPGPEGDLLRRLAFELLRPHIADP